MQTGCNGLGKGGIDDLRGDLLSDLRLKGYLFPFLFDRWVFELKVRRFLEVVNKCLCAPRYNIRVSKRVGG